MKKLSKYLALNFSLEPRFIRFWTVLLSTYLVVLFAGANEARSRSKPFIRFIRCYISCFRNDTFTRYVDEMVFSFLSQDNFFPKENDLKWYLFMSKSVFKEMLFLLFQCCSAFAKVEFKVMLKSMKGIFYCFTRPHLFQFRWNGPTVNTMCPTKDSTATMSKKSHRSELSEFRSFESEANRSRKSNRFRRWKSNFVFSWDHCAKINDVFLSEKVRRWKKNH